MLNKYIARQFKKISVNLLIFLIKLFILLKRFLTAFFVRAIWRPGKVLLRLVFYKIIVKIYKLYFSLVKKLGWKGFKDSPFMFLVKYKLVHLGMIAITLILVFLNLTTKARAGDAADTAGKTILASLVESEFGGGEEEQLIEEFFDEEAIISVSQQSYWENLSVVRNQPMVEVSPTEDDETLMEEGEEEFYSPDGMAIIKPDIITTNKGKRTEIVYYNVQSGDTVSTIAQQYGVSVNTILWENGLSAYSLLRPGDKLAVLPASGITHQVARGETLIAIAGKYGVEKEKITEANGLSDSDVLAAGQKIFVPGGKKSNYASYQRQDSSGLKILRDLIIPPNANPAAGNKMAWPAVGHRITQYYSWRHHAVDIANKTGTPIYAADAGTIEFIGWGKGYGNQIVIDHGGGKKTRYAHLSKFYAEKGQNVSKGQAIGAMGSTGWSTGPHLHFEIIINGGKYNPLNYIK